MIDRVSLLIIGVFFTIMLAGLGFIAVQTREVVRISREIAAQHQTFLANQATILRDHLLPRFWEPRPSGRGGRNVAANEQQDSFPCIGYKTLDTLSLSTT